MADILVVLLGNDTIGEVVRDRNGRLAFFYDGAYRRRADATPLSASMPLARREHDGATIGNFMWGLLPDNERVLERWAREFQVSPRDPFGLLTNMGEDCPGAVQFARPDRVDEATQSGGVSWSDEAAIANRLRILRSDDAAWRPEHNSGRFSLAGVQAKFALFREGTKWGEPYGRTPTTHIIKPGISGVGDHALNEHLCMTTARKLGLSAAMTEIVIFEDQPAIVIERFDRAVQANKWIRIHQEDACQALGLHPSLKYQAEGGPGVAEIAKLIRSVVRPSDQADVALLQFADALALNWLLGATDAHAKNYSFLYVGRTARFAPLYDIASYLPYGQYDKLKTAMKIGGEYRIKYMDAFRWRGAASELGRGVDKELFVGRVASLAGRLPDALSEACSEVSALGNQFPNELAKSVRRAQRRAADLLRRHVPPLEGRPGLTTSSE
jgi:serine/threonine-protein kinase HipA